MISTLSMWSPLQSPAFLPVCTPGCLSLSGLYLSSREHRTRDSSHVSSTNNMQGELLLVCTCVCAHKQHQCAREVRQSPHISISSFCLESKVDGGQIQTTPTEGETLTDILIDFNTDFTCRPGP